MCTLFFVAPREERHHMKAVVSETGGVTIPKAIRKRLGIAPRTVLAFSNEGGRLVAVKERLDGAVSRRGGKGLLPNGLTVEEYIDSLCGS
jgi:bifunctional DNA-binding transcriptional regulator/antitoxin component of YhaV-PrlF toxin-antitoxin module